jgi:hypothetical protein
MTGQYNAYVAEPKRLAPNISWAGSREKCIPESLSKLWNNKVKTVDFNKSRPEDS